MGRFRRFRTKLKNKWQTKGVWKWRKFKNKVGNSRVGRWVTKTKKRYGRLPF